MSILKVIGHIDTWYQPNNSYEYIVEVEFENDIDFENEPKVHVVSVEGQWVNFILTDGTLPIEYDFTEDEKKLLLEVINVDENDLLLKEVKNKY